MHLLLKGLHNHLPLRHLVFILIIVFFGGQSGLPILCAAEESSDFDGQYILGPGDVLSINLFLNAMESDHNIVLNSVPITPDGNIFLPMTGDIRAVGLTRELLAVQIIKELKKTYKNPFALVVVTQTYSHTVTVLGDFLNGKFPIMRNEKLYEFIGRNATSRNIPIGHTRVKILRNEAELIDIMISKFLATGSDSLNPVLLPGDQIIISKNSISVTVLGDVTHPGYFELQQPSYLIDAIAKAQGLKSTAKIKKIRLRHEGDEKFRTINLQDFLKNKNKENNPMLMDGDIVFVPQGFGFSWVEVRDIVWIISSSLSIILLSYQL